MKKDTDLGATVLGCFGILTGAVLYVALVVLLSIFVNAWALSTLWGWIVVPIFHLQPIVYWQAYGITVLISYLTSHTQTLKSWAAEQEVKTTTTQTAVWTVTTLIGPVLTVFFTWIVLHFIFGAM